MTFGLMRFGSASRKLHHKHARESHYDTNEVYEENLKLVAAAGFPKFEAYMEALYTRICEDIQNGKSRFPHYEIRSTLITACGNLYIAEGLDRPAPQPPDTDDEIELARYRDKILSHIEKARTPETLSIIDTQLRRCFEDFVACLPSVAIDSTEEDASAQQGPAIDILVTLPDIPKALQALTLPLYARDALGLDLFKETRTRLSANAEELGISSVLAYDGDPKILAKTFLRG